MENIFANKSMAEIRLPGPNGEILSMVSGDSITGISNYYQRYIGKISGFVQISDDGTRWVDGVKGSGKIPYAISLVCDPGTGFKDNGIYFPGTIIQGAASFCQITATSGQVFIRINDSIHSEFALESGSSQSFDENDLLVNRLEFATMPGVNTPTIVEVIATGIPTR